MPLFSLFLLGEVEFFQFLIQSRCSCLPKVAYPTTQLSGSLQSSTPQLDPLRLFAMCVSRLSASALVASSVCTPVKRVAFPPSPLCFGSILTFALSPAFLPHYCHTVPKTSTTLLAPLPTESTVDDGEMSAEMPNQNHGRCAGLPIGHQTRLLDTIPLLRC